MAKEIVFKINLEGGDKTIKTLDSIEKEIVQIKTQLKDPALSGDGFKTLNANLDATNSKLKTFDDDINSSVSGIDKLEGGTKLLAGGISIAAGAFALFGAENEKAAEALLKVQGGLAIAQGVGDLADGFGKLGLSTSKVSAGFKTLGNAIKGNPILLLVGVIVSLLAATGNLDDLISTLGKTFGDIFEKISPVLDALLDLIDAAIKPLLNILGPLVDIFAKSLIPILNLTLLPLQLFASVLEAAAPIITLIAENVTDLLQPFIALTEGIGPALDAFFGLNEVQEKGDPIAKSTTKNAEALQKAYDLLKLSNDAVNSAKQFEIDLLKAQGGSIDEIRKKELDLAKTKREQSIANAEQVKRDAELLLAALGTNKKDQEERDRLNGLITASNQAVTDAKRSEQLLQANIDRETAKERADAVKKANDDAKKIRDDRLKSLSDAQKKELDGLKKSIADEQLELKNAADQDIQALRDKLTTEGKFGEDADKILADAQRLRNEELLTDQLAATQKQLKITSEDKKLSNAARLDLEESLGQKIIELDNQLSIQRRENLKQNNIDELNEIRENYTNTIDEISTEAQGVQIQSTKDTTEELNDLNNRFRNGEINNLEDYEIEKQKIIDNANDDELKANEITAQKTLDAAVIARDKELGELTVGTEEYINRKKELDKQIEDADKSLADARLAISEDVSQKLIDNQVKTEEELLTSIEKQVDAINTLASSLGGLIQPLSENFNNLNLQIFNLTAGLSTQLPALFEKLKAPIDDSLQGVERTAAVAQKVAAAVQFAAQAIGEIGNLINQQNQERLDNLQQQSEEEITTLEENKDAAILNIEEQEKKGVITKDEADKQKLALQNNFDTNLDVLQKDQQKKEQDLRRKAFNQEKTIRIATAVATGLAATLNAFAAGAVFGPITAGIFAGLAGAFSAIQVGLIKKTKFPEDGGGGDTSVGGGAIPSIASATQAQPATQFQGDIFGTGASQESSVGFGNNGGSGTMRAYVVESDISSTQNRLSRIRNSSEL